MSSSAYYMFRNLGTKQVVGSVSPTRSLKQIKEVALRPPHIREDLWTPFVVAGNLTPDLALRTHLLFARIPKKELTPELLALSKRERIPKIMNQIEDRVTDLCRIYMYLEAKLGREAMPEVKLYWEQEALRNCVEKHGLAWPTFMSHRKLDLIRGRHIANPELVTAITPELPTEKVEASHQR
ncbi:hypothetical protein IWQ60_000139 [Tieghemiomyces parasiticus]|uniref:Uncharacterized protein n=1 Tax=Tieghemiomyces parasiticus TaxID=78921 RepID=A0A9W8DZH0_9FUNG|nr:hypothetical protein IWQ60_000139 [Tieghemiomyces parasiticus]